MGAVDVVAVDVVALAVEERVSEGEMAVGSAVRMLEGRRERTFGGRVIVGIEIG